MTKPSLFSGLIFAPCLIALAFMRPSLPALNVETLLILAMFAWWMWGANRIGLLDPSRTMLLPREDVALLRLCLGPAAWVVWIMTPVLRLSGAPIRRSRT